MSSANYQRPSFNEEPSGAREQAKQTAGNAAEAGKHVGGVAKHEARQVATEARQQARNLLDDAKTQVEDQSRTQRDRLVSNLRTFTDDLEHMAAQSDSGTDNQLVQQVASAARSFTDQLDQREPAEMLDEVRRFARRRPGAFLLGAFAAGVVAGRGGRGGEGRGAADATGTGGPPPNGGRGAAGRGGLHPDPPRQDDRLGLGSPGRTPGGGRRYSRHDIAVLREVVRLSSLGISLEGVRQVLELENQVQALQARVRGLLHPGHHRPWPEVANELETVLRGWSGYFAYGSYRRAFRRSARYVLERTRHFLRRRHKVPSQGTRQFPADWIAREVGLHWLERPQRGRLPRAVA